MFKPSYHKGVPVDGFSKYAADIWDKIVHNRDLDLPTQQQLLAQYRCDEISKTIYQGFAIAIKVFKIPLEEGTVFDSFGIDAANLVKTALQDFDTDASRYNSLVYQTARADFASKLYSALHVYFIAQVRNSFKTALVVFEKYCKVNLLSDDSNFSSTLDIASKSCLDLFRKSAKASVLSDSEWQYADVFNELKKEIEAKSTTMKKEALERLAKSMDVSTKMKLTEPVACALNDVEGTDTWPKIVDILNNAIEKSQEMLQIKLSGIGMDKDMIESSILAMKMHAWDALIKTLKRELSDLPVHDKLKRK